MRDSKGGTTVHREDAGTAIKLFQEPRLLYLELLAKTMLCECLELHCFAGLSKHGGSLGWG